jgi:hypothetical protein
MLEFCEKINLVIEERRNLRNKTHKKGAIHSKSRRNQATKHMVQAKRRIREEMIQSQRSEFKLLLKTLKNKGNSLSTCDWILPSPQQH